MKKDVLLKPHFEYYYEYLKEISCDDILEKLEEAEVFPDIFEDTRLYEILCNNLKNQMDIYRISNRDIVQNLLCEFVMVHRYKKIYQFEETITNLLLETSLKKLDMDFVKIPYPSIYLSLPYNENLKLADPYTGEHRVRGIYVYFKEITSKIIEAYPETPVNAKYVLRYLAVGEDKNPNDYGDTVDSINYGTAFLGDGDIFEQLKRDVELKQESGIMEREIQPELYLKIHSFIINAVLYITSAQARLDFHGTTLPNQYSGSNPKKRKRANKENKNASDLKEYCKVGKNIIIKPPSGFTSSGSAETDRKIMTKFKVSPHWHTYWTGKGRSKRELKFITEYTKGKDFDDLIGRKASIVQ